MRSSLNTEFLDKWTNQTKKKKQFEPVVPEISAFKQTKEQINSAALFYNNI